MKSEYVVSKYMVFSNGKLLFESGCVYRFFRDDGTAIAETGEHRRIGRPGMKTFDNNFVLLSK